VTPSMTHRRPVLYILRLGERNFRGSSAVKINISILRCFK